MLADLKGKTALVTGAGKKTGIGYAIARKLAQAGAQVVIADLPGWPRCSAGPAIAPANMPCTGSLRRCVRK